MKQFLNIGKEPNFQKIIITSAILHLVFIALVTTPFKSKEPEYKSYFVNIVSPIQTKSSAVARTGKKGKEARNTVKEKPKPSQKVAPVPKKGVSLEPKETARLSREIERLRAMSNLQKKKQADEQERERIKEEDKVLAEAIAGIKAGKTLSISKGAGIPGSQRSSDVNTYAALVQQKIWSEWIYLELDANNPEVVISFRINKNGIIMSPKIIKSSGNTLFDRSAMNAVRKASPLPPPAIEDDYQVRFTP